MGKKVATKKEPTPWQLMPINRLVKAGWNYKTEDGAKQAKLVANIKRNGQVENILIRELDTGFYEVVNGNHRLDAFNEIGLKEVMTFNLGRISDAAAMRIAVETNETRFETDNMLLAARMKEISQEFSLEELEQTMPYSQEDLQRHIQLSEFDWKSFEQGMTKDEPVVKGESDEFRTVSFRLPEGVADQLEDQVERFKRRLHPADDPTTVSPVMAIEAMTQCLAQIPDDRLM